MREKAKKILEGAYEVHVHTAPSHYDRLYDDFEYAHALDTYNMAGSIIKTHFGTTAERALIANKYSGAKAQLYGGITLDWAVGGLNPYAVHAALLHKANLIWMPTFHAYSNQVAKNFQKQPVDAPGIKILDDAGNLKPEIFQIFEEARAFDTTISTGHLSAEESVVLCEAGLPMGIRFLLGHPDSTTENVPVEIQRNLAQKGVILEKCWLNVIVGALTSLEMARRIRTLGPGHCVLSTDLGQKKNIAPAEGMLDFIEALLDNGITESEINLMTKTNAQKVLHLA